MHENVAGWLTWRVNWLELRGCHDYISQKGGCYENRVVIDLKTKGSHHSIHHIKGKQATVEWQNTVLSRHLLTLPTGQAALSGTRAGHGIPPLGLVSDSTVLQQIDTGMHVQAWTIFLVTTCSSTVSNRWYTEIQVIDHCMYAWLLHVCRVQLLHSYSAPPVTLCQWKNESWCQALVFLVHLHDCLMATPRADVQEWGREYPQNPQGDMNYR